MISQCNDQDAKRKARLLEANSLVVNGSPGGNPGDSKQNYFNFPSRNPGVFYFNFFVLFILYSENTPMAS